MKYILHIDTSGNRGLVALAADGKPIGQETNLQERDHAAAVNLMIARVLDDAGIVLNRVDGIAVAGGPGSYTGLRIGLATAKALCYVLEIPLMMQHKMHLLALQAVEKHPDFDLYAGILPAREKEYFLAVFNARHETVIEPRHVSATELSVLLQDFRASTIVFSGEERPDIREIVGLPGSLFIPVTEIGLDFRCKQAFQTFISHDFVNLVQSEPFYLKQVYTHNKQGNQ